MTLLDDFERGMTRVSSPGQEVFLYAVSIVPPECIERVVGNSLRSFEYLSGSSHPLIVFVGGFPRNLPEVVVSERKDAIYLFVGVRGGGETEVFPFLENARPDIADPEYSISSWVRSIRDGYSFYQHHTGNFPVSEPVPMPVKS